MKKIKAFAFALMATIVAMAPLSSCSNDNDDNGSGVVDQPKYASVAAQYNITDESAAVKSIELTESGRYLVMMNYTQSNAPKRAEGNSEDIYYGSYTAGDDNTTFTLDGFGTMKANDDGSVTITSDKIGGTKTWGATTTKGDYTSATYKKLCRTWTVKAIRMYAKVGNKTAYDISASSLPELYLKLKEKGIMGDDEDDEEDGEDWNSTMEWAKKNNPTEYTFTSTGLIFVKTIGNGTQSYQRWRMKSGNEMQVWMGDNDANENGKPDENEWNHWLFNGASNKGKITVSFGDKKLVIEETESEPDEGVSTGTVYTFEEAE